ncbi:Ubiquitin-associated domain-containing protein 1, partial [Cyphomyrmex costatus]
RRANLRAVLIEVNEVGTIALCVGRRVGRLVGCEINLMIPWVRDQIAEAWHNRKSSRAADKRSLAVSSVSSGNATSNNTMLTPLPTSPENFSINVISMEGNVLDVAIKPNFTVGNIKKIAVVHFYGQDTIKSISSYRLVHSTKFIQLKDENYVSDEDINECDELLLVEIRSSVQEDFSDEALKGPSLEAIAQATSDLPNVRNPPKPVPSTECPADFQNEIRKILITLVQASAKILMYSPYAEKLYDDIKEKLEARCNPINDPKIVKNLIEMGYPHKKVLKALCLRKQVSTSNMTEALEWLIDHQDDSDNDSDDDSDFLSMDTDIDIANPNYCEWLLGERRRSLQDLDEGLETDGPIYNAIMSNPHIQLSLTRPKMLLAYLSMIETPASANVWINDPEIAPVLNQISKTYHTEKHAIHMNRYT